MQVITSIETKSNLRHTRPIRNQSTLIDLSSRFTSLNRPTRKDIALFKEQFYTLILSASNRERKTIAKNLARSEYVPKPVILFFAMEEIAVANLPLLYSPILQARDLNLILAKCSIQHAKVIARRNNLDASNVNTLLKLDDETKQILHVLKANDALLENLGIAALLNASLVQDEWVSQPAAIATNPTIEIKKPKSSTRSKDLSASLLELANKGGKIKRKPIGKSAKSTFNKISLKQVEKQLLAIARFNDEKSFATSVERFCGLNCQATFNLLRGQDAGMLASLLCALEISEISAARILLMMNRDIGRNAHIFKVVMGKYKNLDHQACVLYFTKLGADFTQARFHNGEDKSTTRYALSLAARDRRASLLKQSQTDQVNYSEQKLTA